MILRSQLTTLLKHRVSYAQDEAVSLFTTFFVVPIAEATNIKVA